MRIAAVFEKSERLRHIGHLDIQRSVQRGLRRSGLPVAYSNGFNPHILVSFASALSTGACGKREIMDVSMAEDIGNEEFINRMNKAMPPEMPILEARAIDDRHPSFPSLLKAAEYDIRFFDSACADRYISAIPAMIEKKSVITVRKTKSGLKECDIRPLIYSISSADKHIFATMALTEKEACKPGMLLNALRDISLTEDLPEVIVTRTALLGTDEKIGQFCPLETL